MMSNCAVNECENDLLCPSNWVLSRMFVKRKGRDKEIEAVECYIW